ncbi:histidinol dehydrogenase [Chachezhania antarctica]|uniref:histidinol dehydrogenase n=1 Tax=Chachezhania antarctica TaxID=2340860 RepID=UPI000EAFE06E|nr:histidinol dehydrogenase [Chachezhania antarctica]|tara:strand:+ start:6799 stop:8073 length:1275 start_codon:yes stop_codon:yes gene_type:complete
MTVHYLKSATPQAPEQKIELRDQVTDILLAIEKGGEAEALRFARRFDRWEGDIVVTPKEIEAATARLSPSLREDIDFAHENIRRFADAQRATLTDMEIEMAQGFMAGQKSIPVLGAGCYAPGGRFSHVASALMTITTAKAAGVEFVAASSPPRGGFGISDEMAYAMHLAGADTILRMGGVQAIASMAFGFFGMTPVDVLAGPGNSWVAEAKRQLFGRVGIDMVAGPTDSLILADSSAHAEVVSWDMVGQMEHGADSPVWLVTDDADLASAVLEMIPGLIGSLPAANAESAAVAWANLAEIVVCDTREEMARMADTYAPEHLHVQARDLDWWLGRLKAYGSLFLGEETTVAFGDKASGPNHVLPTSGAARYTGGLSVHKFLKTVTWQKSTAEAARRVAEVTARISRMEGMEAHARTADIRLSPRG